MKSFIETMGQTRELVNHATLEKINFIF